VLTDHQAKYYAHELTRRRASHDPDRLSQSLFDASVDLNPHQIDAALFALQNPLTKGVLLADEVGLGKTIEAALVIGQYWAERRRRLLVICPAALRKQWANELTEKFHLPTQVLDARTWREQRKGGIHDPFDQPIISVVSYHFAAKMEPQLRAHPWDLVTLDEAHKLRNAHRDSNILGQAIRRTFAGSRKLLLTATPLQNSLLELYGLSTLLDEQLFGDAVSFRSMYMQGGGDIEGLRARLEGFCRRTLRRDVLEYVRYTKRMPLTFPFTPSADEQRLYQLVSAYLQRENSYGVPHRQRHLVALVIRKLLASSTSAVINTLETLLDRLRRLEQSQAGHDDWLDRLLADEAVDEELLDEAGDSDAQAEAETAPEVDLTQLQGEIAEIEHYLTLAHTIDEDEKSHALLKALEVGFSRMDEMGAPRKAVIFTESRRTQEYLARYLERHGLAGKVVTFSGQNSGPGVNGIYQRWLRQHQGSDHITGSPAVDRRTALIDHFRDQAEILIATEAAAEGVNLQFCSLVVNYDLPWNPQRVEQRIGRCHRYGQRFDVVVVNFLNQQNAADRRVLELLSEKFHLFDGLFGASDDVLGRIESGLDIERRIAAIYAEARTPEAIEAAFDALRKELEASIQRRMEETEAKLLAHFDEQIHERLRLHHQRAEQALDRITRLFWYLSRHLLGTARFDDDALAFTLTQSPTPNAPTGLYQLIRKGQPIPDNAHLYRLAHPLGEYLLDQGRALTPPDAELTFDLSGHPHRISVLDNLAAKQGWLELHLLSLKSFQLEEHLVFTALADDGTLLDPEACERLFNLHAEVTGPLPEVPPLLAETSTRQLEATLAHALEQNDHYFQRERDKLDQWAEDQIHAAEQQLEETKLQIRDSKRRARTAQSVEEQKQHQERLKQLEREQRRHRQAIFDVDDQIEARRDQLIAALEARLHQQSGSERLLRLRWVLV